MRARRELQVLAAFVHGVTCGLHILGFFYNLLRRNWWQMVVHGLVALFDGHAAIGHSREGRIP